MILRTGTKVRVRLYRDPKVIYNGEVTGIFLPRGQPLEVLDLRGQRARRTRVRCWLSGRAGPQVCVLNEQPGRVRRGFFDEVWSFDPDPKTRVLAGALVRATQADPTWYAEARALFRERVVELQAIAVEYDDTEAMAWYAGDPDELATGDLAARLASGAPEPAADWPERSTDAA